MKKWLAGVGLAAALVLPAWAAESDADFAVRLHQHMQLVREDPRVLEIASHASPSNVTVEFQLDDEGRVGKPKIVHSILSQQDHAQILAALTQLPPIAMNGYAGGKTYRLPLRLDTKQLKLEP